MAAGEGQVPGSAPGCGAGERCGHSDKSPQGELLLQRSRLFFFFFFFGQTFRSREDEDTGGKGLPF